MSDNLFPSRQIDDDTYYGPTFLKFGTYEMESQYYPLIGELVSVFNTLEDSLSEELVDYIENDKMPNIATLIVSRMSFSAKWQLWVEILLNYINEDLGEISPEEKLCSVSNQSVLI